MDFPFRRESLYDIIITVTSLKIVDTASTLMFYLFNIFYLYNKINNIIFSSSETVKNPFGVTRFLTL